MAEQICPFVAITIMLWSDILAKFIDIKNDIFSIDRSKENIVSE
jgi:hypothetical protein